MLAHQYFTNQVNNSSACFTLQAVASSASHKGKVHREQHRKRIKYVFIGCLPMSSKLLNHFLMFSNSLYPLTLQYVVQSESLKAGMPAPALQEGQPSLQCCGTPKSSFSPVLS